MKGREDGIFVKVSSPNPKSNLITGRDATLFSFPADERDVALVCLAIVEAVCHTLCALSENSLHCIIIFLNVSLL